MDNGLELTDGMERPFSILEDDELRQMLAEAGEYDPGPLNSYERRELAFTVHEIEKEIDYRLRRAVEQLEEITMVAKTTTVEPTGPNKYTDVPLAQLALNLMQRVVANANDPEIPLMRAEFARREGVPA